MRPTAEHARPRPAASRRRTTAGLVDARALLRGGAVAVALFALAGCTGNADAGPSPTTTVVGEPSASASASASGEADAEVEKPERPAAMDRDDAEGAAAAAEYFIELYPYVMATGDTAEFEAMSHEACGFCTDVLNDARRVAQNEESYIGGQTAIAVSQVYEQDELTGIYPLDVSIVQEASRIIDRHGEEVSSLARTASDLRVEVGRRGHHWVIAEVASAPGGK